MKHPFVVLATFCAVFFSTSVLNAAKISHLMERVRSGEIRGPAAEIIKRKYENHMAHRRSNLEKFGQRSGDKRAARSRSVGPRTAVGLERLSESDRSVRDTLDSSVASVNRAVSQFDGVSGMSVYEKNGNQTISVTTKGGDTFIIPVESSGGHGFNYIGTEGSCKYPKDAKTTEKWRTNCTLIPGLHADLPVEEKSAKCNAFNNNPTSITKGLGKLTIDEDYGAIPIPGKGGRTLAEVAGINPAELISILKTSDLPSCTPKSGEPKIVCHGFGSPDFTAVAFQSDGKDPKLRFYAGQTNVATMAKTDLVSGTRTDGTSHVKYVNYSGIQGCASNRGMIATLNRINPNFAQNGGFCFSGRKDMAKTVEFLNGKRKQPVGPDDQVTNFPAIEKLGANIPKEFAEKDCDKLGANADLSNPPRPLVLGAGQESTGRGKRGEF